MIVVSLWLASFAFDRKSIAKHMNIFLLLAGIFLFTFLAGILLEKIRIPWIFAALILGLVFAFYNPFQKLTSSEVFNFLAWLGMYFLLFLIGFELEIEKIKKLGRFIAQSTFFIIFFEAIFGSLLIHFVFGYSWFISILVALSFATVGEAVLIPILDEFKLTKTKIGQTILGIGTLDDIIEVLVIVLVVVALPFLLGWGVKSLDIGEIAVILLSIFALFIFVFGIIKLGRKVSLMEVKGIEAVFLLLLAIFFLFLGLGAFAETTAVGALLAGLAVRNFLPSEKIRAIEKEIRGLTYGFFGPIFFFWVGLDTQIKYLFTHSFLIFLVIGVTYSAKILASYIIGQKELGRKPAIFMGIALGVRFSTSIVIIKFLFEKALIGSYLYSVLIGSAVAFKFIIPFLLALLVNKWRLAPNKL